MRLAVVLALLVLVAVTFAHPSASRIHTWPWAAVLDALWLLPLVIVTIGAARCPVWRLPSPTLLAGLGLLAAGTLLSAASSPFAPASLPRVWPTLSGVALVLLLHHAWSAKRSARVVRVIAYSGALLVVVAFVAWWNGAWPLPWGVRNAVPFGHSTYTAGAVVLFLPWIVREAWQSRGAGRTAWLSVAALALVVIASTSSRGSALAVAFVAAAAALVVVVFGRASRARKLALLAGLAAVAALLVATNPRLRDLVLNLRWGESSRESNVQRRAMIDAGVRLGLDRPALGWGPGTVPLVYPEVRAQLDGGVDNVLQLHSTPAQLWATTGAVGLVAAGLILLGVSRSALRAPRDPIVLAAVASLLGYAVVALTDHQLDLPLFTAMAAVNTAVISTAGARAQQRFRASPLARSTAVGAAALVAVCALPPTLRDLGARQHYDRALTALERGEPETFRAQLDRATALAPHDPFFDHHFAGYLLSTRLDARDPSQRAALDAAAVERLRRSLATGAHREFAHFNLGWLCLDQSKPAEAARHFTAAARLVPDKGGVYFGLGLALLEAGDSAGAVRAFALEWINDPRSVTSVAWETPALAAHVNAIHAEMIRLYAILRPQHPRAGLAERWTRWWRGDASVDANELEAFSTETAAFLSALPAIQKRQPLGRDAAGFGWARLYAAWQANADDGAFLSLTSGNRRLAEALARRAHAHREEFRAFLASATGDEAALVRTYRRQRAGYGILALHPEGPPLTDLYVVQENRVTADFAAGLFPRKGWVPGRFLLALLPEPPR